MEFLPPRDIALGFDHVGCFKSKWVFYSEKMKLIENDAAYD